MHCRKENMLTETKENLLGGEGRVLMTELLGEKIPHIRILKEVTLEPGSSIGVHPHHEEAEAYLILEGEATIQDQDSEYVLLAGEAHLCKNGDRHGVINKGDKNMRMIAIVATLAEYRKYGIYIRSPLGSRQWQRRRANGRAQERRP